MTKKEYKELLDFIRENKFTAKKTDGWSYYWSGAVVEVDVLKRKLENISRRKSNRKGNEA